jgi:hypothetical protein
MADAGDDFGAIGPFDHFQVAGKQQPRKPRVAGPDEPGFGMP